MTETQTNTNPGTGNGLGIAGLVVGIVALLFSIIPCLGMYAIFPAVIGVILSGIGLFLSTQKKQTNGLAIAGLVVSILATVISGYQMYVINNAAEGLENNINVFGSAMQNTIDSIQQANPDMSSDLNNQLDSLNQSLQNLEDVDGIELLEQLQELEVE